jgi:hypothetical protein
VSGSFGTAGQTCSSAAEALETAIYNALLAFCVNRGVMINDVNVHAYVFVKDLVNNISADVEAMGEVGNSVCLYLDRTRRGIRLMIRNFAGLLRRHPCGEELANKLEGFAAEIRQCLNSIGGSVRLMNENVVVALLLF